MHPCSVALWCLRPPESLVPGPCGKKAHRNHPLMELHYRWDTTYSTVKIINKRSSFCSTHVVFCLGNGQWDILELLTRSGRTFSCCNMACCCAVPTDATQSQKLDSLYIFVCTGLLIPVGHLLCSYSPGNQSKQTESILHDANPASLLTSFNCDWTTWLCKTAWG